MPDDTGALFDAQEGLCGAGARRGGRKGAGAGAGFGTQTNLVLFLNVTTNSIIAQTLHLVSELLKLFLLNFLSKNVAFMRFGPFK